MSIKQQNNLLKGILYLVLTSLVFYGILSRSKFYYYRPFFIPFGNRLNTEELYLEVGDTSRLYIVGINKRVTFSTKDFKVAGVYFTGKVEARRVGTTVINARVDGRTVQCKVIVIALNHKQVSIQRGQQVELAVEGTNQKVIWTSNDSAVASIDRKGVVTGVSCGKAKIIAKVNGVEMKCNIIVE